MIQNTIPALFKGLSIKIYGDQVSKVNKIEFDSRKIETGDLFVAIPGTIVDGHKFIDKAIEKGAVVVICELLPEVLQAGIAYFQVEDSAHALGVVASNYYGNPSRQLKLIGVTGTNGKTTTVTLLYDLFRELGYKCGLISTINYVINDFEQASTHTTPNPLTLNNLLLEMVEANCDFAFMEVSSHAMVQKRVSGIHFAGGVFTNMSHDHLDYHKTFKAYIEAKKLFFDQLPKEAFALINIDDKRGRVMVQNTLAEINTYSLQSMADFRVRIMENAFTGLALKINEQELIARLIGEFNAYNLIAVYGVAILLEQDSIQTLTALSKIKAAEGRFDYVTDPTEGKIGIVDYSHTPDALEKALDTIEEIKMPQAKVITVVGCGGDRDKQKRPVMAKVASSKSDLAILTSDNPRTEDPFRILKDMEEGITPELRPKVFIIENRKEAIRTAVRLAGARDVILVAGKGHEKYQEINGVKHPFDDKAVLKAAFEE